MTDPTTPTTADAAEQSPAEPAEYTPPATQADLDRIIAARVKRTRDQFPDYAEMKTAKAELDQIRAANQTETERQAQELTRWQSEAEKWRTSAVGSTISALASDFADPSDAASALDVGKYLDAGGQIDEAAIKADLAAVLERKPHWRRQADTPLGPRVPAPNLAQGTGGKPASSPADQFASIIQGQLRS